MTHTVAATSNALAATAAAPARAARSTDASFASVRAAAVKDEDAKGASSEAPKGERTDKVPGHGYAEIVGGPRNGMFLNNTGGKRDGQAFVIVKRDGREFHIYGTGEERKVFEVGRERSTTPAAGTTSTA